MAKSYTFFQVAHEALELANEPLDRIELWEFIKKRGLDKKLRSEGKTPWETMAARLYVDIRENPNSPVMGIGSRPIRFWLRSKPLPHGWSPEGDSYEMSADSTESKRTTKRHPTYRERDLHPLVAHFALEKMGGVRVKTINHSASKKKSFGEWVHPDLVGVLYPMTALGDGVTVDFTFAIQAPVIRIYSFELKRAVRFSNLRECFFQAVSNSSWAHEGYLVAVDWLDDPEFHDELARLSRAFGIGAIRLDLDDPGSGEILLPARTKDELDWATLDKLVVMNRDVRSFLETVKIDIQARRIHDAEYDEILDEIVTYSQDLAKGRSAKHKRAVSPRKKKKKRATKRRG
jgi:hypothetical protein